MHERSTTAVLQDAVAATGNGAVMEVTGRGGGALATLVAQVTGTFTATITWEGTVGVSSTQTSNTWVAIPAENITTGAVATTATAAGIYRMSVAGLSQVRARVTWTSGTSVTVTGQLVAESITRPVLAAFGSSGNTGLDGGPGFGTLTRTVTVSADMTAAAAITPAPSAGERIYATDIVVSTDTAMNFLVEMETSGNDIAKVFLPANGTAILTLRGLLKGDADAKKFTGKASAAGNVAILAVTFSAPA